MDCTNAYHWSHNTSVVLSPWPIGIGNQVKQTYTGDETSEVSNLSVEEDQSPLLKYTWVQCEDCEKWRKISNEVADQLGEEEPWCCQLNTDQNVTYCDIEEEDSEEKLEIMLLIKFYNSF